MIRLGTAASLFALFALCAGGTTSDWPTYDRWSDCAGFCEVASQHCKLTEAGEGMMCQMQCDVAAQWEGQEMPDETTKALREQLICAHGAKTCDQLQQCLAE